MNIEKKIEELGGIEITNTFISKKENDFNIANYLNIHNLNLSSDYIEFSIKYGFGQFNNDVVFNSINRIPVSYNDGTIPITFIYGWGRGDESLQETRLALLDQIRLNYFVFAEGNPGDYLLIDTVDGKIHYYLHDGNINNSFFLVAENFQEFIDRLKVNTNPEPEDDIEEEWFSDDF